MTTEQDLARIEDLLFEINNQLKALESQAKKAEKYFEIKKEYKIKSIELAKAALEGFNIQYKELTEQQQQETDKRFELEAKIKQRRSRYRETQSRISSSKRKHCNNCKLPSMNWSIPSEQKRTRKILLSSVCSI